MSRQSVLILAFLGALGAGAYFLSDMGEADPSPKAPVCPPNMPCPAPMPAPVPPKPPPRLPLGPGEAPAGRAVIGGRTAPDGTTELQCDLPEGEKKKNVGGSDGSGLCVFTSMEYCARWQNERRLFDFQARMRKEPGGGYPEKVDKMMEKYGQGV